jgi:hypothetical protein
MLSAGMNERLARVGRGTPAGELLRLPVRAGRQRSTGRNASLAGPMEHLYRHPMHADFRPSAAAEK